MSRVLEEIRPQLDEIARAVDREYYGEAVDLARVLLVRLERFEKDNARWDLESYIDRAVEEKKE